MKEKPNKTRASEEENLSTPKPVAVPDDVDTAKVLVKNMPFVTFESIVLSPGERGQILLIPDRPVRKPKLFMSNEDASGKIVVEQVFHGRVAITGENNQEAESYRYGRPLDVTVTESEPLKIVVVNCGANRTTVGASLVMNDEPKIDTTYRLKGEDLKE